MTKTTITNEDNPDAELLTMIARHTELWVEWDSRAQDHEDGPRGKGAAMRPMRSRSRTSHLGCARKHGVRSGGGKAPTNGCARGLHVCV